MVTALSTAKVLAQHARVAGRYRVERLLGIGGMGKVHQVLDEANGRTLALKRLLPGATPTQRALFEREYRTLAVLEHSRA